MFGSSPARFKQRVLLGTVTGILLLDIAVAAPQAATAFELEAILAAPYPTDLVAAPAADRIAWVLNDRGIRNLWTAAAPDFTPVQLTAYTDDDGQTLGSLQLTPDGSVLVFVRGGGPNSSGEIPNPTSHPEGARQEVWAVRTEGGPPWKLAEGSNPAISPRGDRVIFLHKHRVHEASLEGSGEGPEADPEAKLLFQARGTIGSLAWSPDGTRIAFVSSRGDHSFVGVLHPEPRRIVWMAPGVDRDQSPAWSPDGTKIAFFRFPGARTDETFDSTRGVPFSIWVGDPATGEAREIWRSPGPFGGFAQRYPNEPLRWAGNDLLLFTSEHEGWLHVYALPSSGGEAQDLTPGEAEVEDSVLAAGGQILYFSGNHGDIDRRHLWRVPVVGGEPKPLTFGQGIETDVVPLASGNYLAFRSATARRPQAVTLLEMASGKSRLLSPRELPPAFPAGELVEPEAVVFPAADGLQIHGQLFLPRGARPGDRRPAVIFLHGGPIRQMLLGWHYRGYYANAYAFNQYLATRGYVVLSVNFRSGIGYGRDFRQAPGQGPRGATEYQDVLAAGLYLRRRPEVDPERIGLWGGSYGGYLTALGLARDSDLFAAGVDLHGVHDWSYRAARFPVPGGWWGIRGEGAMEEAYRSSPVAHLDFWTSPVLLIHGDDDRNVLFAQSVDLAQRLRERGVPVETLVFPDEVHGFLRHENWLRAYRAAADFFHRVLERPSAPGVHRGGTGPP